MSLLELTASAYSSLLGTWLPNQVLHLISDIKWRSSLENIPEHQKKLNDAIEILDRLSDNIDQKMFKKGFIDLETLIEQRKEWVISTNEKEEEVLRDYDEAISLLHEAKALWDTYSICLLTILNEFCWSLLAIRHKSNKSIKEQERINWSFLSLWWTIWEHNQGIFKFQSEIEEWAKRGNAYALYEFWKILKKQWKNPEMWVVLFKESFLQWNPDSAYELAEYYYNLDDESYKTYLELGLRKLHPDSINLQWEIFFRLWSREEALKLFKIWAYNLNHQDCFVNLMLLESDKDKRDKAYGEVIERRAKWSVYFSYEKNIERLISYEPQSIWGDRKILQTLFSNKIKRILETLGQFSSIKLDSEEVLKNFFFQRKLSCDDTEWITLWQYNPVNTSITVDTFLYLEGLINHNLRAKAKFTQVLCHEIIHKVSRESWLTFDLPRFLDEWIVTSIEEFVMNAESFVYPQEKMIFEKLLEYSRVDRTIIFKSFLSWNSWYIRSLLSKYIHQIIEHFSTEEGFQRVVLEMEQYCESSADA